MLHLISLSLLSWKNRKEEKVTPRDYEGLQGSLLKDVITLSPGFIELDKKGEKDIGETEMHYD